MGFIYKITCNITNECYYGSSKIKSNLRLNSHKSKSNQSISKQIIDRGNYTFIILENDIEDDKLIEREYYYINGFDCINKNKPCIKEDNKLYRKRVQELQRYYDNKEEILKQRKENYNKNKEQISIKRKQTYTCDCGSIIQMGEKSRHNKTGIHKKYLDSIC